MSETAAALGAFGSDPAGLVAAARRILDRQLTCGPLWWLCSRVLCSLEPLDEAAEVVRSMAIDTVTGPLDARLPDDAYVAIATPPFQSIEALARRGDVEVAVIDYDDSSRRLAQDVARAGVDAVSFDARRAASMLGSVDVVLAEALAVGADRALVPVGSATLVGLAGRVGVPTVLVAGTGRVLPAELFEALVSRWESAGDRGVDADGTAELVDLAWVDEVVGPDRPGSAGWPVAAELLRLDG